MTLWAILLTRRIRPARRDDQEEVHAREVLLRLDRPWHHDLEHLGGRRGLTLEQAIAGMEVGVTRDRVGATEIFREVDVSTIQAFDVTEARAARHRSADFEFRAAQADYQAALASMKLDVEAASQSPVVGIRT